MGLDLIELVIRCEEVFGIELADDDMESVQTAGDLYIAICKDRLPLLLVEALSNCRAASLRGDRSSPSVVSS